jgi:hypothetical protein
VIGKPEGYGPERWLLGRVNCKTWRCEYCGPRRAKLYKWAIRAAAEKHKLTRLLTLTLDPSTVTGDPFKYLSDCFSKLRRAWIREYGGAPKYIRVMELQKNGRPHLHILIDRFMPQAWIENRWRRFTRSGRTKPDVRYIDIHRVARYLSKYLTTDMLRSTPRWVRRVTCSRSIELLEKKLTGAWTWERGSIGALVRRCLAYLWLPVMIELDEEGQINTVEMLSEWRT